jgi:hypothetical protein
MTPALRVIEKAFDSLSGKEFLNFAREIHPDEAIYKYGLTTGA